ncbi:MAG: ATP-dependent Clp protease proteolytic subunit, partial [Erysipelotrichaceae bacterium]|nr:ATP-dependent Clp protease proteolytic subunit [Erysipelotrichaceae bacterium]
ILVETPNIIKETNQGYSSYRIVDEMLSHREIQCVGEINSDLVYSLIMQLQYLQREDPNAEITMYINSPGGEVTSGLALYDVMQAISAPMHTVCVGMAASMASILFAAGDRREILPHAAVMIHDPLIPSGVGGSALKLRALSDDLMRTRTLIAEILSKHSGHDIEEIYNKTATDTYFYGQEAVDYGLADNVITSI